MLHVALGAVLTATLAVAPGRTGVVKLSLLIESGLTVGSGFVAGTLVGILIQGLIQTDITFYGSLSSWWTKILIGLLLFAFILLQKGIIYVSRHRRQPA